MKKVKFLILSFVLALVGALMIAPTTFLNVVSAEEENPPVEETLEISDSTSFISVLSNSNNYSKKITLTDDIYLEGVDLSAVWAAQAQLDTAFSGEFDGNGFVINDLTISSNTSYYGLFGNVKGKDASTPAVIKNLKLGGTLNYNFVSEEALDLTVGTIVGYGENLKIENCEIGDTVYREGVTNYSSLKTSGQDDLVVNKRLTFGGIAGSLKSGSYVQNCVTYLQGKFSTNLTSSIKIGGIVGVIENTHIYNTANFANFTLSGPSGLTFYYGGIVGEILSGSSTEIINSVYDGSLANEGEANVKAGGVVGLYSAISSINSINISFDYWTDSNLSAQGEFASNSSISWQSSVRPVDAVNILLFNNKANWHEINKGWNMNTVWNYKDSKLHLQVFQTFNFRFANNMANNQILNEEGCSIGGQGLTGDFKYGKTVVMTLAFQPKYNGFYSLAEVQHSANDEFKYTKNEILTDGVISGYEIIVDSSSATSGEYSFVFNAIKFNCSVIVHDDGDGENKGGVRYEGASTSTKNLSINDLSIESAVQNIEAVAIGRFNFVEWKLFALNSDDEFVEVNAFRSSAPTLRFKFGDASYNDISKYFNTTFRLEAYFSDDQAIEVGFIGFDHDTITSVRFNGESYTGEFPIKVSSIARVELVVTVKEGYEFNVNAFLSFMSRRYGGDDTSLLNAYGETPNEDGSTDYKFTNINMASIKKGLGEGQKFDIELRTSVKVNDNDDDLLWLWITLPIVGVFAIAGGLIAFFIIRRQNMMRRIGGDGKLNSTQNKIKKTKAKEVDYKDYYN